MKLSLIFAFTTILGSISANQINFEDFIEKLNHFNLIDRSVVDGEEARLSTNLVLVERMYRKSEIRPEVPVFVPVKRPEFDIGIANDFFEFYHVGVEYLDSLFGGGRTVCLKKGTPADLLLDYNEKFMSQSRLERTGWFVENCLKVELGIINFFDHPFEVHWVNDAGNRTTYQNIVEPGERQTSWRNSYIGHHFLFSPIQKYSGSSNYLKENLHVYVKHDLVVVLGQQKSQIGKKKGLSHREAEAASSSEKRRSEMVKKTFSKEGYKRLRKQDFPRRLWASIRTFWNNNRHSLFEEKWIGKRNYVNWWETTPTMAVVPFGLKKTWHTMLQPLMEEWCGEILEPTDLYGIRVYYNNSWLFNHVDRTSTHAVSAIINVEQVGLEEDWELEFVNHQGQVVHSDLQQGEGMFYESAKVIHGRPKPLRGKHYANVFFHYRPINDPKWYLKPTKEEL